MKANFLLAATYDIHGRFSPFSPDCPINTFQTDYFRLQQTPHNRVFPGESIGVSGDWVQGCGFLSK